MAVNKSELLKRIITCTTSDARRQAWQTIKNNREKKSFFGYLFEWPLNKTHVWGQPQFQRELLQGLMSASPEAELIFGALFSQITANEQTGAKIREAAVSALPVTDDALREILSAVGGTHGLSPQLLVTMSLGLVWLKVLQCVADNDAKKSELEALLDDAFERAADILDERKELTKIVAAMRGALGMAQKALPEADEEKPKKASGKGKATKQEAAEAAAPQVTDARESSTPHAQEEALAVTTANVKVSAPLVSTSGEKTQAKQNKKTASSSAALAEAVQATLGKRPDGERAFAIPEASPTPATAPVHVTPSKIEGAPKAKGSAKSKAESSSKKAQTGAQAPVEGALRQMSHPIKNTYRAKAEPEEGLTRTIGYAVRYGGFVNFYGVANWDPYLKRYSEANFTQRFPMFGAVNLKVASYAQVPDGSLLVLDWGRSDLIPYHDANGVIRTDYAYQFDYAQLKSEGRASLLDDAGVFPVVRPLELEPDFTKSIYVTLTAQEPTEAKLSTLPVMLEYRGDYYGPFPLREDAANRLYVNVPLAAKEGVVSGLRPKDASNLVTAELRYWHDGNTLKSQAIDLFYAPGAQAFAFDTLSDKELVRRFLLSIPAEAPANASMREAVAALIEESEVLGSHRFFSAQRALLLRTALNDCFATSATSTELRSAFFNAVWANKERVLPELAEAFANSPEAYKALTAKSTLREKLQKAENDVKALTARKANLTHEINEQIRSERAKFQETNQKLLAENERLTEENERMRSELGILENVRDLATTRKTLQDENAKLSESNETLRATVSRIEAHLEHAFKNPHEYAFEGAIASKLLAAASAWESEKSADNFEARAHAVAHAPHLNLTGHKLANYLVKKVQSYRGYDDNTVLNFFILLTQSFLTIFSGPPGVGKTSICEILAHVMGLSGFAQQLPPAALKLWDSEMAASRFLPVSVERGWTSKRDFVGYYNPLSKTFESIDPLRKDAFAQLDAEKRAGVLNTPFMMLLDEANLSPMEYYWGDFMRIADKRTGAASYVSFGGDAQYRIPDTLRFVATINNDFTTENLSPRLLDRAAIVTLPAQIMGTIGVIDEDEKLEPVNWTEMQKHFGPSRSLAHKTEIEPVLERIYAAFMNMGVAVSMRTRIAIADYISAANRVFSAKDRPAYQTGIDFAVMQRLLPRINGNGSVYRAGLVELAALLEREGLTESAAALAQILRTGDSTMDWYRFF